MSHSVNQGVKVVQSCKYASNGSIHFKTDKIFDISLKKMPETANVITDFIFIISLYLPIESL